MNEGLILDNLLFTQDDFNLNLSLTVPEGAFACLLGPSGCGKTTLLRLIGGFASPAGGTITLRGRDITETEPHRRRLGIVFQDYALFPHLSVEENIAYGLKTRRGERPDKGAIRRRVEELLDLVELKGYARRRVPSLSGGEQQRIALARALAPRPDLLLLDEPLSALDVQLRASLRREIRRIQERLGVTTLYITHDQEEALTLSDRIYLMRGGRLLQEGTPEEIYGGPETLFAGRFLGRSNTLKAKILELQNGRIKLKTAAGVLSIPDGHEAPGEDSLRPGMEGFLFFRPEDCLLLPEEASRQNRLSGRVAEVEYYGSSYLGEIEAGGEGVRLFFPLQASPRKGEVLSFSLRADRGRWFSPKETL